MIIVKVTYKVREAFAAQNQQNINAFMEDLRRLGSNDFRYNIYKQRDGQTFVHLSHYKNAAIQQQLLNVPSFLRFQQLRDDSGLEGAPQIEVMDLIAASNDIFDDSAKG